MDCNAFEERWMEALDVRSERGEPGEGAVPGDLAAHLAECGRCRELVAAAGAIEPPSDLVGSILGRTSGSPCARARQLLAARVDIRPGELDPLGPLLRVHLDGCARCARLVPALAAMGPDLARLAEIEPAPDFVADVLAATLPATSPAAWERLVAAARQSASWKRLLARPRLALEGAFLASAAVVLLLGIPSESVSDVPARVLAKAREERNEMTEELGEFTSASVQWLGDVAEDRWERLRPRLGRWLDIPEDAGTAATGPGSGTGERSAWARWSGELLRIVDRIQGWLEALLADSDVASRGTPDGTRGEVA